MKKLTVFIVFMLSLFVISSCSLFSSSSTLKHYYQVSTPSEKDPGQTINATLRIKTFNADKIYKRYNLVYRTSREEMFYYNTHFWASRPDDMITDIVANRFAKQQIFSEIIVSLDKKPDYVLSGRIVALDEMVQDEKKYAEVAIIFELKDYKTSNIVVAHSFDRQEEAEGDQPVDVVRAMGRIIDEEMEVFISKIFKTLDPDR